MKKLILFLLPILCFAQNLTASDFNDFMEKVFPFPILSVSTGQPEFLAADIGIETLFLKLGDTSTESRAGVYLLFSPSRAWDNTFFRFSTGLVLGTMGLMEARGGIGYGFMKEGNDFLYTYFFEGAVRLFILQCKIIMETPLKPDNLVEYYNNQYKNVKFQIGLSI